MKGTSFGKYEVVALIGEGGFGRVFEGRDPDLKRPVAIKTCSIQEPEMRGRFLREAEIAARLRHPNITTVYDFGREDGEPYLVQEYLTGEDLDHVIKAGSRIPLATRVGYLIQMAEGLGYAHAHGVIHRDVKPANIRVLEDGQVRIMDFGIAKLVEETQRFTQVGMTIGTAGYLSPEQLQGLDIDHRSDIFSFGVLAYELVLNRSPFQADSISALFYSIAHEEPAPLQEVWPECPPRLAACVSRCLEKDRDARYGTFAEVTTDLQDALAALDGGVPAPSGIPAAPAPGAPGIPGALAGTAKARTATDRPEAPSHARRKWLVPFWALLGVALLVAFFEVVRFPGRGEANPGGQGVLAPATSEDSAVRPALTPGPAESAAQGAAEASPALADPPPAAAEVSPGPDSVAEPVSQRAAEEGGPEEESPAGAREAAAPFRGSSTLVFFWSGGGSPDVVTTAENAFLEELLRRRRPVVEAGLLAGVHGDPTALALAQGLDARAVSSLGRRYDAEVVVVGSLRTESQPSAGRFFTGRAVLDVRTYRASTEELLGSATYQAGSTNTPGKLGPSPLAAETEAAREVGRMAAAGIAREYGKILPGRR